MDTEILRLWNIVTEITEQLNQNRLITSRLHAHAGQLQEQAGQVSDSITLRRFNTDIQKESFTSEVERFSAALVIENQTLLHENKQLNTLLQEYENTLHTVMEKFRGHSHAAQTHQLTLNRHYETLLARERTEEETAAAQTMNADQLKTLTTLVGRALCNIEGKDPLQHEDTKEEGQENPQCERLESPSEEQEETPNTGLGDWMKERETEIQRLERENEGLRKTLGITPEQERELGLEDQVEGQSPVPPSPFSHRHHSFSRSGLTPLSLREDRNRGGGRGALGFGGEPRRPGLFGRGGFEGDGDLVVSAPERRPSPPNLGRDATSRPVVESI